MDLLPPERLPLVPEPVLRAHKAYERNDSRFRSCARLLQSLWREKNDIPMGAFVTPAGRRHRQGNLLSGLPAHAGANFVCAEVHHLVRRELAYREPGAMVDVGRVYGNLLSSMPLAFNAFGLLKLDAGLAERVVAALTPDMAGTICHIQFEHSPGRGDPAFTADGTAFDVFISIRRADGAKVFLAVEVKYSESMVEPEPRHRPRYDDLSLSCSLFRDPDDPALRRNPLQQLWREHMLSQAIIDRGLYDDGRFVLLAPRLNNEVQRAATRYAGCLRKPLTGKAGFSNIVLEDFIEAMKACGAPAPALALEERYTDFAPVHALFS